MNLAVKVILGVALVGAVGAIVGANAQRDAQSFYHRWKVQREAPLEVLFEAAGPQRIVRTVEAPGEVEADVEVEVSSQVVSRILTLPVREGEKIKRGDLLAQLDSADYQAQVRSAEARVQRLRSSIELTKADIDKSKRDLENSQQLFKARAVGSTEVADLDTVVRKDQARLAMTNAELIEAEAMLAKAQEDLSDTVIRSPIDGVVSQLIAEEGEVVVMGTMNNPGTVILVVSDLNTMVVRARVDETDIPLVKPGQKARIHVQYDEQLVLTGSVVRITPKGTKASSAGAVVQGAGNSTEMATFETVIRIEDPPPQVRLGMNANVEIQVEERSGVVAVPTQAVLHRRLKDLPPRVAAQVEETAVDRAGGEDPALRYHQLVFVEENGIARCRLVRTGVSDQQHVEVLDGVRDGERVIAGPYRIFDKLKDSKPVKEFVETE